MLTVYFKRLRFSTLRVSLLQHMGSAWPSSCCSVGTGGQGTGTRKC